MKLIRKATPMSMIDTNPYSTKSKNLLGLTYSQNNYLNYSIRSMGNRQPMSQWNFTICSSHTDYPFS